MDGVVKVTSAVNKLLKANASRTQNSSSAAAKGTSNSSGREATSATLVQRNTSEAVVVSLRSTSSAQKSDSNLRSFKQAENLAEDLASRIEGDEHSGLMAGSSRVLFDEK